MRIDMFTWITAIVLIAFPIRLDLEAVNTLDSGETVNAGDGLGVAFPDILDEAPLYFYSDAESASPIYPPVDSISFFKGEYTYEVRDRESRENLKPLGDKLDYGIFFFRVNAISRHALEVVIDERTGSTVWISRGTVRFQGWPEFLASVNTVERIDKEANPLRMTPAESSEEISYDQPRECLEVLEIRGGWMRVKSSEVCGDQVIEEAWIRWRADDKLLITYNLLS